VGVTDLDSNLYDAVMQFKKPKAVSTEPIEPFIDINSPVNKKDNEFGDIVTSRINKKQRCLQKHEIQVLITAYEKGGKSTYELAEQFGCHRATVSNILKRHNVVVSNCKGQNKLNAEDVTAMYENMYTTAEIAKKYEVGPDVVIRCLRANGVMIRGRWEY